MNLSSVTCIWITIAVVYAIALLISKNKGGSKKPAKKSKDDADAKETKKSAKEKPSKKKTEDVKASAVEKKTSAKADKDKTEKAAPKKSSKKTEKTDKE